MKKNKFEIGEIVIADGMKCKVIDQGEYEGKWYYSCVLVDGMYFPRDFEESKLQKMKELKDVLIFADYRKAVEFMRANSREAMYNFSVELTYDDEKIYVLKKKGV